MDDHILIADIREERNLIKRAALVHIKYLAQGWSSRAWKKAIALRNRLINQADPVWPHDLFWTAVGEIVQALPVETVSQNWPLVKTEMSDEDFAKWSEEEDRRISEKLRQLTEKE